MKNKIKTDKTVKQRKYCKEVARDVKKKINLLYDIITTLLYFASNNNTKRTGGIIFGIFMLKTQIKVEKRT